MKHGMRIGLFFLAFALSYSPVPAVDQERDVSQPESPELAGGRKAVKAQDFRAALEHLTKAAAQTPKDADVHNLLGYSYRKTGQLDKAMEHYRLALSLDSKHRGAHEYMGELYLELGQLDNAEKQLATLHKTCPWLGKCKEHEDLKEAIEKYKTGHRAGR